MLERENFNAILEADDKSSFERALSAKPNLILVDLRSPGMSGVEDASNVRFTKSIFNRTPLFIDGENVNRSQNASKTLSLN